MPTYEPVGEVRGDPARSAVYEHGWQSWSPAGRYPATATGPRPRRPEWQTMAFRPDAPPPPTGFQGEGLLAVVDDDGLVHAWWAPDPRRAVPSIRAEAAADRVVVSADGPVVAVQLPGPLPDALGEVGNRLAATCGVQRVAPLPPAWCSWYGYWGRVTPELVLHNLAAIDRLDLPVATVQIDDGHQAEIGDWLDRAPSWGALAHLADRITDTGRAAGIWTAPFLVGARSRLAREHPEWLVRDAVACAHHWEQEVRVLDVTHPGAAEHLTGLYRSLAADGYSYHKIDFIYAGAMAGGRYADCGPLDAYREGLRLVREAIGPDATLLGCGAPLLPSIGLVDAMRVSPDIDPRVEPDEGDLSQPSQRGALAAGRARAWMHGRLWVNDPDCLLLRPEAQRREAWAEHLLAYRGLAVSGDPLDALDDEGLRWTRELLRPSAPQAPTWEPESGDDQGRLVRS